MSWLVERYRGLTIGGKMVVGYLPLVVIILVLSLSYFVRLERIMAINEAILARDIPAAEAAEAMIDSVLSQELYANRFLILGSREMHEAFALRGDEFDEGLGRLQRTAPPELAEPVAALDGLHARYEQAFEEGFSARPAAATTPFSPRVRALQDQIIARLKEIAAEARRSQEERTRLMAKMQRDTFTLMAALSGLGVLVGAGAAFLITRDIARSVDQLKEATSHLSEGRFDELPILRTRDEFGELSRSFCEMSRKLKALEEMRLDSSPLTRLPGGQAVELTLKTRVDSGAPFAFCLIDVDNFKAYNDRYGYSRGNDVIRGTARIVADAVRRLGTPQDFVGHIGGDDFVVISSPEHFAAICQDVIAHFDAEVPGLYDPADRERGCVEGANRQGAVTRFPLATVSIAVVTSLSADHDSHLRVSEVAATIKEYAKTIPGSKYVVDRRVHGTKELSLAREKGA